MSDYTRDIQNRGRRVLKYSINITEGFLWTIFAIPKDSWSRSVGIQETEAGVQVVFWMETFFDQDILVDRRFELFATGVYIPGNATYIGTIQYKELVLHLYETPLS